MTLTPPEEPSLSAERPVRSEFARPSGLSYATRRVLTICFLLLVAGGGFYFAFGHSRPTETDEIPTIKAEEGAVKERPAQPGGIDIPHQDVQVYRELEGNNASKPQIEHLLPPSETPAASAAPPLPVQKPVPPPVSASPSVPKMESLLSTPPKLETTVAQVAPASPPLPTLSTQSQTPVTPIPAPAPVVPAVTVPATPLAATVPPPAVKTGPVVASVPVVDTTKPAAANKKASVPGGKKGTAVQLASVPDEAGARNMMGELQSKYAGILGSVKLRLVKADLGARGIFYRIQSQPVTKEQADDICTAVKGLKAGCIIVHL